jgi:DNA primase
MIMKKPPSHLYDYVKQKVDLSEFLENDIGCRLQWLEKGVSARCSCPMPHHRDTAPSFYIRLFDDSHVWIYNCFGCGAKGSIIDFFVEYYGLDGFSEAVVYICNKFNIKMDEEFDTTSLNEVKKKANLDKKMEYIHIVSSNQCRMLLRKNYDRYYKWVASAYRAMNKALDKSDIKTVEAIGFQASSKIQEKAECH